AGIVGLGNRLVDLGFPESWRTFALTTYPLLLPALVFVWMAFHPWQIQNPRAKAVLAVAGVVALALAAWLINDSCAWFCSTKAGPHAGPIYVLASMLSFAYLWLALLLARDSIKAEPILDPAAGESASIIVAWTGLSFFGIIAANAIMGYFNYGGQWFGNSVEVLLGLGDLAVLVWVAWPWGRSIPGFRAGWILLWGGFAVLLGMIRAGLTDSLWGEDSDLPVILYSLWGLGVTVALYVAPSKSGAFLEEAPPEAMP